MPTIRLRTREDWVDVSEIFRQGIAAGHATLEAEPPTGDAFDLSRIPELRLVAEDAVGKVVGWVAASRVSTRQVYQGVVEHSIYVAPAASGSGVGRRILQEFIRLAESQGIWTIQATLFEENQVSLKLHLSESFRIVVRRELIALMKYGPKAGFWRDALLPKRRAKNNQAQANDAQWPVSS